MKTTLICLAFLLSPMLSLACSCANAGDFCTLLPQAIGSGTLVIRGNPVKIIGHGMEFKIDEVISGSVDSRRIMIWGDPGYLCRTYVTGFKRSDELLMILNPISRERTENTTGETERVGDYSLSVCGQFFVYLNGKNKADIDCYTPLAGKPSLISAAPNPTSDSFRLLTEGLSLEDIVDIKVYNANGQLLYRTQQLTIRQEEDTIEISSSEWINGLYFVDIRTIQNRWLAKVLVVK